MSNQLQIFNNSRFGQIRTIEVDGKVLFAATDAAKSLGYKDPYDAIRRHTKGSVKRPVLTDGGTQEVNFIPEGDIYRLAAKSELPGADEFETWIFDEVIPSIRKHGAYMTTDTIERVLSDPDTIIQIATTLKEERSKRLLAEKRIEEDKPKVLFADSVAVSNTSILIGELAKIIKQNGIDIGEKRLFKWLRTKGYLISRQGTDYNAPTQKSMELELFKVKETVVTHSDGHVSINKTTKVTGKGQVYFVNKFLENKTEKGDKHG